MKRKLYILILICFSFFADNSLSAQIPTDGLVAFYPFDGNASDKSGNGLDGYVNGAVPGKDRCDIDRRAYFFDGDQDYITIGDITNLDGLTSMSISVWIYSDGIKDSNSGTIISKHYAEGNSERVFIFDLYPDNTVRLCIYGADGNADWEKQRTIYPIPKSQWNHVVVNWSGQKHKFQFYVNGKEVASRYESNANKPDRIYNKNSVLMVGGTQYGKNKTDYMFNGRIDELRIYSRELTYEEVLSLYYFNCNISEITGETQICQGQAGIEYSVLPLGNAKYSWEYTGSDVTVSPYQEKAILNFGETSTSGDLVVTMTENTNEPQVSKLPITVLPLPEAAGMIVGKQTVCNGYEQEFSVPTVGYSSNYNWTYIGTGVLINGNSNNVSVFFTDSATSGDIVVSGINNCGIGKASPPFPVLVKSCEEKFSEYLKIPNSFSPNGDGLNDLFVIDGITEGTHLLIFSRTGKKLFESENYTNNWDGKDLYGNDLNSGTYWYVLEMKGINNSLSGFVYLKR